MIENTTQFMTNEDLETRLSNIIIAQVDPYVYFDLEASEVCSEEYNDDGDWQGWKVEKLTPKELFKRLLKGK